MTMLITISSMLTMKVLNPMLLAISVLTISVLSTITLFKTTMTSWMAFVVILTFSSGMMTLFMYTTSFSPNEKTKNDKMSWVMMVPMTLFLSTPTNSMKSPKQTMKMFTNLSLFMFMAAVLIMTMLAISSHGHHPNQTISTSF